MVKPVVEFRIDMTDVNRLIGTVYAIDTLGSGTKYMQNLIAESFDEVDKEFNRAAAASAVAGHFKHMFEWGTVGINTSRSNMRPKPDSEIARLWKSGIVSGRTISRIDFVYKKSKAHVPIPTTAKTGIKRSILSKLKDDHIFRDKAEVIEENQDVEVNRIDAPKLFIPLAYKGITGPTAFMMPSGPTFPKPGKNDHGKFTAFFKKFWEGVGTEQMQAHVSELFQLDLDREIARINLQRGMATEPSVAIQREQIQRTKQTVARNMVRASEQRKANNI